VQYITQERFDAYSGLYFHLKVPSPDEAFGRIAKATPDDSDSIPEFVEMLRAVGSIDELHRGWNLMRLQEPATAARWIGTYAREVSDGVVKQIRTALQEHPAASGESAEELRGALTRNIAALERDNCKTSEPPIPHTRNYAQLTCFDKLLIGYI
jgi:hypothetical protein